MVNSPRLTLSSLPWPWKATLRQCVPRIAAWMSTRSKSRSSWTWTPGRCGGRSVSVNSPTAPTAAAGRAYCLAMLQESEAASRPLSRVRAWVRLR